MANRSASTVAPARQKRRDRARELVPQRLDRAREQLMRGAGQGLAGAGEGGPGVAGVQGPHGDLRLHEGGDGAQVGAEVASQDGLHGAAGLVEAAEQDLGAGEDEALHGGVAGVAEALQGVGGGPGGASGLGRGAAAELDLDQGGAGPGGQERVVVGAADRLFEGRPRQLEVAELGVGDAAEGEAAGAVVATYAGERAQRVAAGEGAGGVEEGVGRGHAARMVCPPGNVTR
ncbi:hypothetical protein [Nannocystis pusilla]|uniref:hypothetical protein n=1 Tax=Nannocystis pusilla TaxID=889268 RepID=UPI003DA691C0